MYGRNEGDFPGPRVSLWFVAAAILGVIAYFSTRLVMLRVRMEGLSVCLWLAVAGAVVCFALGLRTTLVRVFARRRRARRLPSVFDRAVATVGTTPAFSEYDRRYIRELAEATNELYGFLTELDADAECIRLLHSLPGLEPVDRGRKNFTIDPRLAAFACCDARDCFFSLGNDPGNLQGRAGIGYAMLLTRLINREVALTIYEYPEAAADLLSHLSHLEDTANVEVDIEGREGELRFGLIFGLQFKKREWARRYSTLMHRWASLIATADGKVTPDENATLAYLCDMRDGTYGV